ncbi:hypothetical protein HIM_07960 [Hirsutella minnesotensis 3608]|uniref:Peptidase A1 domain-containing protein n=1 Tax=Hirsutella minnesotensis 3608 TaxID=1043627 RepID=A0A0F7ZHG5_9HYPO|nr:hypothetical protein HIM_07960 [Hirsutella minnesotensis 3608]
MASVTISWLLGSLLFFVTFARELKVVEGSLQHFHGKQFGSFIPMVEIGLGGDGKQKILGQLDTGSADLVLAQKNSAACEKQQQDCQDVPKGAGSFDPDRAPGTTKLDIPFNASFVSGESFTGQFIKTGVQIGDKITQNVQLGLYSEAQQPEDTPMFPIFGTGPIGGTAAKVPYPNVPEQMKLANMTNANAYGVYMNDFRGTNGQVVFGGYDTAKFQGQLQEAPVVQNSARNGDLVIDFSSLNLVPGADSSARLANASATMQQKVDLSGGKPLPPAFLDTGSPSVILPKEMVQNLARTLGANFSDDQGMGPVDCGLARSDAVMEFGFNKDSIKIRLPLEMMLEPKAKTGSDDCMLAVLPSDGPDKDIATLGAAMMQAAYIVFDIDQKRLLMAQAKPNVTESAIKELPPVERGGTRNPQSAKTGRKGAEGLQGSSDKK